MADLARHQHDLNMSCLNCDCHRLWGYDWLVEKLGEGFRVAEWSARYRCPGCGLAGTSELRVAVRSGYAVDQSSLQQRIKAGHVQPLPGGRPKAEPAA